MPCERINNPNLPFFKEAKMLQADLVFTDNSIGKVSVRERYQIPITSLLSTSHTQEVKTEQNNFVKGFIVNDIPNTEFPEHLKALQNLTVSPGQ